MPQYFEYDPNLKSNIKQIKYTFKGKELIYDVDNGVFSKDRVDFGTNVLLNALPDLSDCKYILDMGCGYGAIGLAIAKAYPKSNIDMVDVNQKAVELTLNNALKNRTSNVKSYVSNLYEFIENNNIEYKYDCIISNPPIRAGKNIVHGIVINGFEQLKESGKILLVIQKKQGAPSLKEKMEEVFGNVEIINKENGYFILQSIKNN